MLIKMTEFFIHLPDKKCSNCGIDIEEQHECYINKCNECFEIFNLKSTKSSEEAAKSRYRLRRKNGKFILQKLT